MVSLQEQTGTPIYEDLIAKRTPEAAERVVNLAPPVSALASQVLHETHSVPIIQPPERTPVKEKKFLSLDGYSSGTQALIKDINDAILQGEHTVRSRSFVDFANDHRGDVTSHEFSRFQREVRAL